MNKPHKCPVCEGAGNRQRMSWESGAGPMACQACKSTGVLWAFEMEPVTIPSCWPVVTGPLPTYPTSYPEISFKVGDGSVSPFSGTTTICTQTRIDPTHPVGD